MSLDDKTRERHEQAWLECHIRTRQVNLERAVQMINEVFQTGIAFQVTVRGGYKRDVPFRFEAGPKS